MGKRSKRNGKKNSQPGQGENTWGALRLGQFRLSFPQPRLPRLLGATSRLNASNTIYPAKIDLDVPFAAFNETVAAGSVAASGALDLTTVTNWSTRFASLFREYCIVGARVEVRLCVSTTAQGVVKIWIDEDSAAAPTANQANSRATLDVAIVANPDGRVYTMDWKPLDYLDLDWTDTGTTVTSAYLKAFGSTATGLAAGTTAIMTVTGTLAVCFRGYV